MIIFFLYNTDCILIIFLLYYARFLLRIHVMCAVHAAERRGGWGDSVLIYLFFCSLYRLCAPYTRPEDVVVDREIVALLRNALADNASQVRVIALRVY